MKRFHFSNRDKYKFYILLALLLILFSNFYFLKVHNSYLDPDIAWNYQVTLSPFIFDGNPLLLYTDYLQSGVDKPIIAQTLFSYLFLFFPITINVLILHNIFFLALTIYFFYDILTLYMKEKYACVFSILFLSNPIILAMSRTYFTEFILLALLSAFIHQLIKFEHYNKPIYLKHTIILGSICLLIKQLFLIYAMFILFYFIYKIIRKDQKIKKHLFILKQPSTIIPVLITIIYYIINYKTHVFFFLFNRTNFVIGTTTYSPFIALRTLRYLIIFLFLISPFITAGIIYAISTKKWPKKTLFLTLCSISIFIYIHIINIFRVRYLLPYIFTFSILFFIFLSSRKSLFVKIISILIMISHIVLYLTFAQTTTVFDHNINLPIIEKDIYLSNFGSFIPLSSNFDDEWIPTLEKNNKHPTALIAPFSQKVPHLNLILDMNGFDVSPTNNIISEYAAKKVNRTDNIIQNDYVFLIQTTDDVLVDNTFSKKTVEKIQRMKNTTLLTKKVYSVNHTYSQKSQNFTIIVYKNN